ncbi:MAG: hypothetical protein IJI68_01730 [Eggerthellaceae bacterium]|nr:hypothetical protein [Eggerthellaceae bacterium]
MSKCQLKMTYDSLPDMSLTLMSGSESADILNVSNPTVVRFVRSGER